MVVVEEEEGGDVSGAPICLHLQVEQHLSLLVATAARSAGPFSSVDAAPLLHACEGEPDTRHWSRSRSGGSRVGQRRRQQPQPWPSEAARGSGDWDGRNGGQSVSNSGGYASRGEGEDAGTILLDDRERVQRLLHAVRQSIRESRAVESLDAGAGSTFANRLSLISGGGGGGGGSIERAWPNTPGNANDLLRSSSSSTLSMQTETVGTEPPCVRRKPAVSVAEQSLGELLAPKSLLNPVASRRAKWMRDWTSERELAPSARGRARR